MKNPLFVLLIIVSSVNAFAQAPVVSAFYSSVALNDANRSPLYLEIDEKPSYVTPRPPGLRQRNAGRTMTILGSALFVGGIFVLRSADEPYYTTTQTSNGQVVEEGDPQGAVGVLMITGGLGLTIPGIILWTKGSKKYNRYLEKQDLSMNVGRNGLGLAYRF